MEPGESKNTGLEAEENEENTPEIAANTRPNLNQNKPELTRRKILNRDRQKLRREKKISHQWESIHTSLFNYRNEEGKKNYLNWRVYCKKNPFSNLNVQERNDAHREKYLDQAREIIRDQFNVFDEGRVVIVTDRLPVITTLIQFSPISQLSSKETQDLKSLARFATQTKQSTSLNLSTSAWSGSKWKAGWRRSFKSGKSITRYHRRRHPRQQEQDIRTRSENASKILSTMFKDMYHLGIEENQKLMVENNLPSFSSINIQDQTPISEFNISPNLTFTADEYDDFPNLGERLVGHKFSIFMPQNKHDGSFAEEPEKDDDDDEGEEPPSKKPKLDPSTLPSASLTTNSNTKTRPGSVLVFPLHKFAIDISSRNHVVKVVSVHSGMLASCIIPANSTSSDLPHSTTTTLSISGQIDSKLLNLQSLSPVLNYLAQDPPNLNHDLQPTHANPDQDGYLPGLVQLLNSPSP